MYELFFTNQFKKDYKLCESRRYKIELLDSLLIELAEPEHYLQSITRTFLKAIYPAYGKRILNPTGF